MQKWLTTDSMHGLRRLEMVEAKQIEFLIYECHEGMADKTLL